MAKNKPKSSNTRAARRGASPSLDLDKSLTSLPRAESPTVQRPSLLVDRASAGVQKKRNNGKKLSRAQRLRQQKGMERAEAVMDQLEIKKVKSVNRARTIKERRADWQEMNKKSSAFITLQQIEDAEDDEEEEENIDNAMATEKLEPSAPLMASIFATKAANAESNPSAVQPAPADEYDEIT